MGGPPPKVLPVSTMVLTGKKRVGGPPKKSYQLVRGGTLLMLLPVSTIVLTGNKKGGWSPQKSLTS